ncbi:retinal rod rhodopsin-sensitive cGMP 3',5'-cyclic phosphodiesterase subunit delta-like protein [Blastocladiella britannica]|nr:retinal rod rhodopsin-sensitive cGMP 3',5'-cyclic phosphodiesterase subunit delta-like protein [Blastocladiella britannica]
MPEPVPVSHLRINSMAIRDAAKSGKTLWKSAELGAAFSDQVQATLPKSILKCKAVAREINFTSLSAEPFKKLRLEQQIYFSGMLVEEWEFDFGFVIPHSTNSWETVIEGDTDDADVMAGDVSIETTFFDGDRPLNTARIVLHYK